MGKIALDFGLGRWRGGQRLPGGGSTMKKGVELQDDGVKEVKEQGAACVPRGGRMRDF